MLKLIKLLIFVVNFNFALAETVQPQDILGSSQMCRLARKEESISDLTCARDPESVKLREQMKEAKIKILGPSEKNKATLELKSRLLENAYFTMNESITTAIRLTGQNPLQTEFLRKHLKSLQEDCSSQGPELKKRTADFISQSNQRSLPMDSKESKASEAQIKKYIVASIELSRIDRMIKDNYVHGEEKEKLIQRRAKIRLLFPLSGEMISQQLVADIERETGQQFSRNLSRDAGPTWIEDYLFKGATIPPEAAAQGSYSHSIAKVLDEISVSERLKATVRGAFSTQLIKHFESIKNLCKADPCTTFNVSHTLTTQALQRRKTVEDIQLRNLSSEEALAHNAFKFSALKNEICACRLLSPPEIFNKGLMEKTEAFAIGSFVTCMGSLATGAFVPVTCGTALVGGIATGGMSAIQGAANLVEAAKTQSAINATQNLPGLSTNEKEKLTRFQTDQVIETGTNALVSVGSGVAINKTLPIVAPYAKKAWESVKGKSKVSSKAELSSERRAVTETASVEPEGPGPLRMEDRRPFSAEWSKKSGTTESERLRYDSLHKEIEASRAAGKPFQAVYRSVENSIQKILNTKFGDFAFIDAINNRRDAILREKIKSLQNKYPELKMEFTSDWKGLHTIAHGKVPESYNQEFGALINQTYKELTDELVSKGILRASDREMILNDMNHSGYGNSFDEVSAARKLDKNSRANLAVNEGRGGRGLDDPLIVENHLVQFKQTEMLRSDLESSIGKTRLMRMDPETGKLLPIRDLYGVMKMSDDPKVLAGIIKSRWGVDVDDAIIMRLKEYRRLLDDQSPALLPSVKRTSANLADAKFGGISSDTVGMNTFNFDATARGAARASDHMQSLVTIREEEQRITSWLNQQVNPEYRRIAKDSLNAVDVRISGDEKKAVLGPASLASRLNSLIFRKPANENDLKKFVMEHAKDNPSLQRHTYIGPHVPAAVRDEMTEHGHSIQKKMWDLLEINKTLPYDRLQNINGMVLMETQSLHQGNVSIIIGRKPGSPPFSESEKAGIRKALDESIASFNPANADKQKSSYRGHRIVFADE